MQYSLNKTNPYTILVFLLFLVFTPHSLCAQDKEKPLLDYFPEMPATISNAQLRTMADSPSETIAQSYYPTLQLFSTEKIAKAIGKIETKKAIILLYAEIDQAHTDGTETLLSIHYVLVDKKKGIFMDGSTGRYLAMSGDDALHHESSLSFSGNQLIVETKESDIGSAANLKTEKSSYKLGKKTLEFIATE